MISWRRRVVCAAALTLCATFALEAVRGPRFGGELRVTVPALPPRLGPFDDSTAAGRLVAGLVQETLVGWSADGQPRPGLAGSWTSAAAGREWTLRLREGALFHDGRAVTGDRAVASLRRFLRSASPAAAYLASALEGGVAFLRAETEDLPGLGAGGDGSVVLRFAQPRGAPLAPLASLSAAVVGSDGAGAGPFAPTFVLPGKRVALRAFAEHIRGRPFLDRLQLEAALEPAERARSLKSGTADLALEVAGPARAWTTALLLLDTRRPPFDEPRTRAAVDAVLDRRDLAGRWSDGGEPRFGLGFFEPTPTLETPAATSRLTGTVTLEVGEGVPLQLSRRVVALIASLGARVSVVASGSLSNARLLRFSPEVPERALHLRELLVLSGAADRIAALEAADALADPDARRAALDAVASLLEGERSCLALVGLPLSFSAREGVHGARFDSSPRLVLEDTWTDER